MENIYEKLGTLNLWGDSGTSDKRTFEVTEAWLQHASGKVKVSSLVVDRDELPAWLENESSGGPGSGAQSLVLRLAWLEVDSQSKSVNLCDSARQALLDGFDLRFAYNYARSCITNVSAFPTTREPSGRRSYSFCYCPKLAAVWSHHRFQQQQVSRQYITKGIIFAQASEKEWLKKMLESKWDAGLYASAMFLPLQFSLLLGGQIHKTEEKFKIDIRRIEGRTGYHGFKERKREPTTEELGDMSAEASGYASKLASVGRKSKMLEKLLDFMFRMVNEEQAQASTPAYDLLTHHVALLQDRLAMQTVDTEYTLKRVQIQIAALAAIISQKDTLANLELSKSTQLVAFASYRDSASMKTLAVVTMFFLPGSFISALFSTSLFDWDSRDLLSKSMGVNTTPQFGLYWVITIPLTVITFLLYFLWLWFLKRDLDRKQNSLEQGSEEDGCSEINEAEMSEKMALHKQRQQVLMKRPSKVSSMFEKSF